MAHDDDARATLAGRSISDRNHSFGLPDASGECVISIAAMEMTERVLRAAAIRPLRTHRFTGLASRPCLPRGSPHPLVAECHASLEYRASDRQMVGCYGLFVLEVVKTGIDTAVKIRAPSATAVMVTS